MSTERCPHCMCKIESGYHERGCPVREASSETFMQHQIDEGRHEITELRKALLAAWTYPAGTPVVVTLDNGALWETETRSEAWALGDGSPVVLLKGKTGGWGLDRVRLRDVPCRKCDGSGWIDTHDGTGNGRHKACRCGGSKPAP